MNKSAAEQNPSTHVNTLKKPRATRACDICRKKKVKCDSLKPSCTNCTMFGYACTYLDKPKKRGPQASNPKTLEVRLKRIESALTVLLENDSLSATSSVIEELASIRNAGRALNEGNEDTFSKECSSSDEYEGLEEEFNQLAIQEQSRYKYFGSSSGMYLLEGGNYHVNGVFQKVNELIKCPNLLKLPEPDFPSKEIEEKLLDVYFTRCHPYFPVFNKSGFLQRLKAGKEVSQVLLNAIYAVACIIEGLTVFKDLEVSRSAVIYFFSRAKTELDKQYHFSSLYTIQGLLLMAFNPAGGWLFLGMAVRMAQDLGLHRNIESDNLDPIEKQNRKLAWWACVVFDRYHSAMGGKPLAINENDFDTTLPMDLGYKDRGDVSPGSGISLRYFTQSVRLTMIVSKIIRVIYVPRSGAKHKSNTNLWSLNKTLSDWESTIGPEFQVHFDTRENMTSFSCLLNIFYQYAVILLNRPFISRNQDKTEAKAAKNPAQLICEKAASRITWLSYHSPLEWQLYGISVKPGLLFSASTIHLINAMSSDEELARVAKINLSVNLRVMRKVSEIFFGARHILTILEDLAKERGLDDLDDTQEPILYDPPRAALSPDISHKLPRRTDSGSVIVLPQHLPLNAMENLCGGSVQRIPSESSISSPSSSRDFVSTPQATPAINPALHWSSTETPNLIPSKLYGHEQFNIAEPIYQYQGTSNVAPLNLFENNLNVYNSLPLSNTPQLDNSFAPYQMLSTYERDALPNDTQQLQDGPVLNILQMEADFEDWNNYLNQFGQFNSNSI
ncbi:hypothetical protein K493DRAFT_342582 [Basidiobolus meristosporus CBS 931.73]|uniref:Zn(2)-C6 fungal-type domain-containing protein n=1 Tax=Basidiobolus meristosporus CBS 931.73 TaxID=1314790 RepID=A0A1Y1X3A7_9FUNG|nr:hypothetical protein K493DRAFT_342582 [Basidiobolus meristosporus CBS 931.73]|eukprot:ORX80291.1 hypothetical protein K493DRAFT_342582 [Basidiobolus meristosporus CBS 931.73]